MVAYYSRALNSTEQNYCVTRKELLAILKAVTHFRPYLYGRPFKLRTDHVSILWLCRLHEPSSQVTRWMEVLAEFQYKISHRAGAKHGNADGMSRLGACLDCRPSPTEELPQQIPRPGERGEPLLQEVGRVEVPDPVTEKGVGEAQQQGCHPVSRLYKLVQGGRKSIPDRPT